MDRVLMTDVTLRDGIQMESSLLSVDQKLALFDLIESTQPHRIEVTSFVHPKWVPQFANTAEFCNRLFEKKRTTPLMAFIPNLKGAESFLNYPIEWGCGFVAVTETFNQKNVNQSVDASIEGLSEVIALLKKEGRKTRVYVSTVFGCPYEGIASVDKSFQTLLRVVEMKPDEIALSDTIGVAQSWFLEALLKKITPLFDVKSLSLHLHNTYGHALGLAQKGFEFGIRHFDGSSGGIGGCPYAKGASGNVASESLAYYFQHFLPQGFEKKAWEKVCVYLETHLGLKLHSPLFALLKANEGALHAV